MLVALFSRRNMSVVEPEHTAGLGAATCR
jgi:hypothetical protein